MDYNELGNKLKEILKLKNDPVAIKWSVKEPRDIEKEEGKSRFSTKLTKIVDFRANETIGFVAPNLCI
jgi:uncharacterized protein (DUF169 family)